MEEGLQPVEGPDPARGGGGGHRGGGGGTVCFEGFQGVFQRAYGLRIFFFFCQTNLCISNSEKKSTKM